jgi:hypothetical protein
LSYSDCNISFAIALHEGGGFDIIQTTISGMVNIKATMGAINKDGGQSIQVDGSPNISFPAVGYGDADDVCYIFSHNTGLEEQDIPNYKVPAFIIYPNPVKDKLQVLINLKEDDNIYIIVTDIYGKIISTPYSGKMSKGLHQFEIVDILGAWNTRTNLLCWHLIGEKVNSTHKIMISK